MQRHLDLTHEYVYVHRGENLAKPFPYISGLSINLGVMVTDDESGGERFARCVRKFSREWSAYVRYMHAHGWCLSEGGGNNPCHITTQYQSAEQIAPSA